MKPFYAVCAALFLIGCNAPGGESETATEKPYTGYDVLSEIRESGWEVSNEKTMPDPRQSEENALYFDVNKVLYCAIYKGEQPDQADAHLKFVQEGGYSVYALPLNQDAEDWEIACEDKDLGELCNLPFEQKMLMVEEWQGRFLEDAKKAIVKLESN